MKNGGFVMDSKIEIYDLIPQKYYPKTKFVKEKIPFDDVISILESATIKIPFIVKPDIGLRGSAVKKIHMLDELEAYHRKSFNVFS